MMLRVMERGDEAAKLANTTAQSIINAYNQEPVSRLHTAQAATTEALLPGVAEAQTQSTEHMRLLNALAREANPIAVQTAQLKLQQERALGNLPTELLRAQVEAAQNKNQRVMDIDTGTVDAAGNPVIIRNVPVETAANVYTQLQTRGQLTPEQKITNARNAEADAAHRRDEARKAEQVLLGQVSKTDKTPVVKSPESQPSVNRFNENSEAPYAYVWVDEVKVPSQGLGVVVPGFISSNNIPAQAHKVPLPMARIGGQNVQLTARDVYKIGMNAKPQLTVRQVLEIMQKNDVIKGKLPWQP